MLLDTSGQYEASRNKFHVICISNSKILQRADRRTVLIKTHHLCSITKNICY